MYSGSSSPMSSPSARPPSRQTNNSAPGARPPSAARNAGVGAPPSAAPRPGYLTLFE